MPRGTRSQRAISPVAVTQEPNISEDDSDELNEQINKCVRYFIYRSGTNEPIKKPDLRKNALPNSGRKFESIVKRAGEILDKVYGFKLVKWNNTDYVTVPNIEFPKENSVEDEDNVPEDINKVLLLLVLANIFMSRSPVNEASLYSYLNALGIDTESDRSIFGKIKNFISVMMKQGYLATQIDLLTKDAVYTWGPRAQHTISKGKILEFVSKYFGNQQPSSWASQYEEANRQFRDDANRERQAQNNDVDL